MIKDWRSINLCWQNLGWEKKNLQLQNMWWYKVVEQVRHQHRCWETYWMTKYWMIINMTIFFGWYNLRYIYEKTKQKLIMNKSWVMKIANHKILDEKNMQDDILYDENFANQNHDNILDVTPSLHKHWWDPFTKQTKNTTMCKLIPNQIHSQFDAIILCQNQCIWEPQTGILQYVMT